MTRLPSSKFPKGSGNTLSQVNNEVQKRYPQCIVIVELSGLAACPRREAEDGGKLQAAKIDGVTRSNSDWIPYHQRNPLMVIYMNFMSIH